MFYKILNILFKLSQFFYFKNIETVGVDKIPENEANLLISNHPSAFKDPILIGVNLNAPINFLAAEEFMGGEKTASFLSSNFNMIPIYRPSTRPGESHKNDRSFDKCYEALNDKKTILIFAEGHSETQSWLDPLKTGAARIALEALKRNPKLNKINIIPVGLNYSNPHQFRSNFLLKIGEVLEVKQENEYDKNTLTSKIEDVLNVAMNGIQEEESDWQETVIKTSRKKNKSITFYNQFLNDKKVIEYFQNLSKSSQDSFNDLKIKSLEFGAVLKKEKINLDDFLNVRKTEKTNLLKQLIFILISIPGIFLNFVPYYLVKVFVNKKEFKYSFEGSMYFAFGTLFFILWHLIIAIGFSFFIGWISLLLPLLFVIFGYFTLLCRDYLLPIYRNRALVMKVKPSVEVENAYLGLLNELNK